MSMIGLSTTFWRGKEKLIKKFTLTNFKKYLYYL